MVFCNHFILTPCLTTPWWFFCPVHPHIWSAAFSQTSLIAFHFFFHIQLPYPCCIRRWTAGHKNHFSCLQSCLSVMHMHKCSWSPKKTFRHKIVSFTLLKSISLSIYSAETSISTSVLSDVGKWDCPHSTTEISCTMPILFDVHSCTGFLKQIFDCQMSFVISASRRHSELYPFFVHNDSWD